MPEEESPEKKIRIRPRGVDRPESSEKESSDPSDGESTRFENVLKNRLKPSGKTFDARAESKPLRRSRPSDEEPAQSKEEASVLKDPPTTVSDDSEKARTAAPRTDSDELWSAPAPEKKTDGSLAKSDETRKPTRKKRSWLRYRFRALPTLVVTAAVAFIFAFLGFHLGKWAGWNESIALATRDRIDVRPEFNGKIDEALAMLRHGDASKAEAQLAILEQENPDVASLSYLRALAAMQAGDIVLADAKVDESIAKGERISDSLSLKAVLASQKSSVGGFKLFGDPAVRSEQFLRQAMVADAANPSPLIELGTLLRYKKRDAEAIALLEAAKTRLNPVDSHTVIDVTLALARAQQLADSQLDSQPLTSQDPASLFVAAYVAMRKGQFASAAQYLRTCRAQLPIDLFDYLVNDPALRKYAREPQLAPFYQ